MPYIEMDGCIYLIGSNGAKSRDPFWVDNLRARPEATIDVRRVRRRVRARIVEQDSAEKRQLWAVAATKSPQYATYQRATSRPIPVVALEDANGVVRFDTGLSGISFMAGWLNSSETLAAVRKKGCDLAAAPVGHPLGREGVPERRRTLNVALTP